MTDPDERNRRVWSYVALGILLLILLAALNLLFSDVQALDRHRKTQAERAEKARLKQESSLPHEKAPAAAGAEGAEMIREIQ